MSPSPRSTSTVAHDPRLRWLALLSMLVVALALRLYRLDQQSLWIDEVSSIEVARQPLSDIVLNYRPGRHPWRGAEQAPLSFLFMSLIFSPALPETTARLPSVLFGVAGVLVVYQLGRAWIDESIGLLAAALLTLSPLHIWYSQEARWYTLWILLSMLSYWSLLRAWQLPSWRTWLLYALFTALSIYTFVLSFLVMASQGFSTLLLARQRGGLRFAGAILAAQVAAVIAAAPVFWLILNTLGLTTGTPRPQLLAQIPYTFFVYAAGYTVGPTVTSLHSLPGVSRLFIENPSILFFGLVFAALVLLGLARLRQWPTAMIVLVPWLFGPLLLTALLALVSHVTFQARYSSAALPAFLLVVAAGIEGLHSGRLRIAAVVLVVLACATSLSNHYRNPLYFKEDARAAAAYLQTTAASAPVYVVGQVGPAVKYYGADLQVSDIDGCQNDPAAAADGRLWLVVGRDWQAQGPGCVAHLSAGHEVSSHRNFAGIEVWLFGPTHIALERGEGNPA
ncbi:MAG TPA: glycosyltransferase family 39 protein [Candidatus Acidoferrales bacterium]|nr:glycosyltransferase family 39 protein [Candidatus Acidoferrales bacterium]